MASVGIVGGGISGLTAAYYLQQQGIACTVFEARPSPGGMIRSGRHSGYLVEYGPNSLRTTTPDFEAFLDDLGLPAYRVTADPAARKRYIVRDGRPIPLPGSLPGLLTTELVSIKGRLQALGEPFKSEGPTDHEESVAAFVRRRLGQEILDYAVNPFVAGIFAGDPEQLSIRHAFPKLYHLEQQYGSLLKGAVQRRLETLGDEAPTVSRQIFSFRDGLQMLPDSIAARLGYRLRCGHRVTGVRLDAEQVHIRAAASEGEHAQGFNAVLITVPLYRLGTIAFTPDLDIAPLVRVHYPPLRVVALGFRRADVAHPLDGFGLLVPEVETDFSLLGTLFSSSIFPGRTPPGHVLLTSLIGGARNPERARQNTEQLIPTVLKDLQRLLGVRNKPDFVHQVQWPRAIPQYDLDYEGVEDAIKNLETHHPRLFFAGNFRRGISVEDAAASGREAASHIAALLG